MKKVIISLLMVCLLINAVFASGSTEDTQRVGLMQTK